MNLKEMRMKSAYIFKKQVKIKSKEFALEQLLILKSEHSKMEKLEYTEIKLQNYLSNESITVQEAKNLFKFRTRVAKFQENMKNNPGLSLACPLCKIQPDTQQHSVQCSVIKSKVDVKGNYSDIFLDNIPVKIARTLMEITKLREKQENSYFVSIIIETLVHLLMLRSYI